MSSGRHDMSKIRINELARELEVKPNVILDMLPELGIDRKMTHSSSLDDDIALAVRQRVTGDGAGGEVARPREEAHAEPPPSEAPAARHVERHIDRHIEETRPSAPPAPSIPVPS